jgi:hypothetical protein
MMARPDAGTTNVEHSVSLPTGVKAIARRNGIEARLALNGFADEVVGTISWRQIDHLRARVFDQR